MVGSLRRVQFCPESLLAGPGMFFEHHRAHWSGSLDDGTWAYRAAWKLPFGASSPNSTDDLIGLIVMSKPRALTWLCMITRVCWRRLLPCVVLTSKVAFWPALAQM